MRDEDKPFVCYRNGINLKIVPRGAAGWRAFAWWLAALMMLTGLFIAVLSLEPGRGTEIVAVIAFLVLAGVWSVAMIRWMLARSEVIDLAAQARKPPRPGSRRRS